jgi:uroporphyrinogen-III synthase
VFTSGSTVRGLVALAATEGLDVVSIPAVCIGPTTASAAEAAGFIVAAVAVTPDAIEIAEAAASVLAAVPKEVS